MKSKNCRKDFFLSYKAFHLSISVARGHISRTRLVICMMHESCSRATRVFICIQTHTHTHTHCMHTIAPHGGLLFAADNYEGWARRESRQDKNERRNNGKRENPLFQTLKPVENLSSSSYIAGQIVLTRVRAWHQDTLAIFSALIENRFSP